MSQHDYNIANDTAANVRADINNALGATVTQNSGASEPATTFANMLWYDTANNILKMRNEADSAWINVLYLDQTANTAFPASGRVSETLLTSGTAATYTVPSNVRQIIVEMMGAGSGGGGVNGIGTSGYRGMAGGGSAGDYTRNIIDVTPGDTFTYTIGAGGAGGAAGANTGSAGTDTTFSNASSVNITAAAAATGGEGATAVSGFSVNRSGLVSGTSSGYDFLVRGQRGHDGVVSGGFIVSDGTGGTSYFGPGISRNTNGADGADGRSYGSGGSGASSLVNNATNYSGGDGAPGLIKIMEIR